MASKVSEKDSLLPTNTPLQTAFGVEDDRKRKKRESKNDDDAFQRKRLFENFTDIGSGRKKKMMNSIADDYSTPSGTLTGNLSAVVGTRKKAKPNTEFLEKKTAASVKEDIDYKVEKKPGRERESSVGAKFKDIDDEEAPFVDLIFSGKKTIEDFENEGDRETLGDAKLAQRSKKVKRRPKRMDFDLSALQLLSSKDEIGMGGQSTWDD